MGSLTTAGEALHPTGFSPQVWKGAAERCRLMEHQLPATHQALQAPEPVTGSSAAVVWTPAPSGVAAPRASHSEGWCGADTNCNEPECLFTTKTCPCNTPSWPGTAGVVGASGLCVRGDAEKHAPGRAQRPFASAGWQGSGTSRAWCTAGSCDGQPPKWQAIVCSPSQKPFG